MEVARAAAGEPGHDEIAAERIESADGSGDWLVSHTFHLRDDFEANLELPYDLTREDADRLAMFVKALPFEVE